MTVTYRFTGPATLDVETSVTAHERLENFEVIHPSYFGPGFNESSVYAYEEGGKPRFVEAKESYGYWQMFAVDDEKWAMVKDGRWDHKPHPLDWVKMPYLAKPLAMRKHDETGLTSLVMAFPADVLAVGTPYSGEYHLSNYFVLFGRTLHPEETVSTRIRLTIKPNLSEKDALKLYETFLKETN